MHCYLDVVFHFESIVTHDELARQHFPLTRAVHRASAHRGHSNDSRWEWIFGLRLDGIGNSVMFNTPFGVTLSPDASFALVCDYNNDLIRRIELQSGAVSTLAGNTTAGGGRRN